MSENTARAVNEGEEGLAAHGGVRLAVSEAFSCNEGQQWWIDRDFWRGRG